MRIDGGAHPLAALAGTHRALVRTSRALGLPGPCPDIWGIAIRVLGAGDGTAPERDDADVLLATTGSGVVGRHVLVPVLRPAKRTFTSLLPFESPLGDQFLLGARPVVGDADSPGDRLDLIAAGVGGTWGTIGEVIIGAPLPEAEGQALRFSPWSPPRDIQLSGWINSLRRPAYVASQHERPDTGPAPRA
ncbi:MAG: putative phosphodiesterase [Ilumatobacteraceae bacterium]|nr:putative phosphodiesterase [Ilumatobacteraceae bacterium]